MSELQYMSLVNIDYFKEFNQSNNIEIENVIRISTMMVSGFRDILNDLNFDEDKFRILQFSLDDSYDIIEEIFNDTKDKKIKNKLDILLIEIAKLDMEIGDLILKYKHQTVL